MNPTGGSGAVPLRFWIGLFAPVAIWGSSSFVSLMNYLTPVWATLLGALVMGEVLPATAWPALILVLGGIAIAQARSNTASVKLVAEARRTGQ